MESQYGFAISASPACSLEIRLRDRNVRHNTRNHNSINAMSETNNPVPSDYGTVTPYLIIGGANDAIEFYKKVFGATERMRIGGPGGILGHAEIQIGDSVIMLADEFPDMGFKSPKSYGGTPVSTCLYVEKVDEVFALAVSEGAEVLKPVENQFYGDRSGTVVDPFGHVWTISSRIEDLSVEEVQQRAAAAFGGGAEN